VTAATWAEFEAALAREIPLMRRDDTVVLDWPPFYVQLGQDSEYLVIEAVSNDGLPADRQLTTDQEAALLTLGWTPPESPPGQPNWFSQVRWPTPTEVGAEFARRLTRTLADVFGVPEPAAMTYQAWAYRTGEELTWPLFAGMVRS
jgi:type III secretion system-like peptide-binding chaperone